jgi:hypothetical protein
MVREDVTSKQVMEELRQKILETGLLPSKLVDVTPLHRGDLSPSGSRPTSA